MKKIILMGRSECGKTTLSQALRGGEIAYRKTQYINHYDVVIDTPGEYAETASLGPRAGALRLRGDVVGRSAARPSPYCLFPPCVAAACTRAGDRHRDPHRRAGRQPRPRPAVA